MSEYYCRISCIEMQCIERDMPRSNHEGICTPREMFMVYAVLVIIERLGSFFVFYIRGQFFLKL